MTVAPPHWRHLDPTPHRGAGIGVPVAVAGPTPTGAAPRTGSWRSGFRSASVLRPSPPRSKSRRVDAGTPVHERREAPASRPWDRNHLPDGPFPWTAPGPTMARPRDAAPAGGAT